MFSLASYIIQKSSLRNKIYQKIFASS